LDRGKGVEALVATLGTEPQVVTLVLDELLRRGHRIGRVVVIHTDEAFPPLARALSLLRAEAEGHYAALDPPIEFHFEPIRGERGSPWDIATEEDAGAVFRTLYRVVLREKRKGYRVHLSIAGGRKVMSVYGMAVAQLLFDEGDQVWHLLSEGRLLDEKRLHADPGEEVVLVPVPVLRWSSISPAATELVLREDPWAALKKQREMKEREERIRLLYFLEHELTPAERELLRLLVREGLPNHELARRLGRSEKTIANQLSTIYDKYRSFSSVAREVKVNRNLLMAKFSSIRKDFPEVLGKISDAERT